MQFPLRQLVIVAASTFVLGVAVVAQNGRASSADNDWPMYSRDVTGSRFSPLADINTGNVAQLTQAWSVQLTTPAGRRGGGPPPSAAPPTDGAEARVQAILRSLLSWSTG
jgi:hypothetical protein